MTVRKLGLWGLRPRDERGELCHDGTNVLNAACSLCATKPMAVASRRAPNLCLSVPPLDPDAQSARARDGPALRTLLQEASAARQAPILFPVSWYLLERVSGVFRVLTLGVNLSLEGHSARVAF